MARTLFIKQTRTLYVIVAAPRKMEREARRRHLGGRCHIALGRFRDSLPKLEAVGIGAETYEPGKGHSYDLCYESLDAWTAEAEAEMVAWIKALDITREPRQSRFEAFEYPQT